MSTLKLNRFPKSNSSSLQAFNAADELIHATFPSLSGEVGIFNDAFGYLTCQYHNNNPIVVCDLQSQVISAKKNLKANHLALDQKNFKQLFDLKSNALETVLFKIPKSNEAFEMYLQFIHQAIKADGRVVCGFMTKYFNAGMVTIAEKYFKDISQTKATKKARLLLLSNKKEVETPFQKLNNLTYKDLTVKQYYGVFSADKIDYATEFLLDNLTIPEQTDNVLDLACGNGIIGKVVAQKTNIENLHFIDDSSLAIASAKLNNIEKQQYFHHHYNLHEFEDNYFDWILTNPPFHFGHIIDISIPLMLFEESYLKLKPNGRLTVVANASLGYLPTLEKLFKKVETNRNNPKFIIYECWK
ncbi:hypothetical protein DNU06_10850 [Putridiphycobacter roseus]|uniref:Uncharacterized protein n=1 Tax=Putridiphycobacter roseus TaxID=2219161 RepID=A0A2W1MZQ6_9FLAO|nr:methyltransferase [Putridiphycobacter roseus]PZE16750.1 hypothetical protein DNU06_10850 [Putridiphycobacter roseus]